ncbi:MAG: hypothetical protein P4L46_02565 [Fimbriimonas sp.]|nr:hypothetical protein [Fimbriimonas sp.]
MTTLVPLLVAWRASSIKLAPAYYSYRSLAQQLIPQGIRLDTSHAPDRTFVISFESVPLLEVIESLETASGDEITPVASGYVVRADIACEKRRHALARKYIDDFEDQVFRGLSSATWAGWMERRIGKLVVGQLQQTKWWQNQRTDVGVLSDFANDLVTLSDDEGRGDARFLCKSLSIDPQSPNALQQLGQCSTAIGFGFQPAIGEIASECLLAPQKHPLLYASSCLWPIPRFTSATCRWPSYLSKSERLALERRQARSLAASQSPVLDFRVDNRTPERPSKRVLEWATAKHANVVFLVNPLLDRPQVTSAPSIGAWLASLSRTDSSQESGLPKPNTADATESDGRSALTPSNCLTNLRLGDTVVVTDEMAFLNEFCEVEESSAISVDNGQASLSDLESIASSAQWDSYRGGSYPVGLSTLGDFPGACPFLALLARDAELNARVENLKDGDFIECRVSDLPRDSQKIFQKHLSNCAQYVAPEAGDNMYAARLFSRLPDASTRIRSMTITFKRSAGHIRVSLRTASPERYEIWGASVRVNDR